MRIVSVLTVASVLASCVVAQDLTQRLEGCPDPTQIVAALKTLRNSDWKNVSVEDLQKVWPTHLKGLECNEKVCSSVISEGRVINGEFECGEVFDFKVSRSKDGAPRERLQSVTIHYTAQTREETVIIAKSFANAIGLSDADAVSVGRENWQQFHWQSDAFGKEAHVLGLQWNRLGSKWNLYLSADRYPVGTQSTGQNN